MKRKSVYTIFFVWCQMSYFEKYRAKSKENALKKFARKHRKHNYKIVSVKVGE